MPADDDRVLDVLTALRRPGLRFLEWGSATGVVTIMADLLGYEAYGIELDEELVAVSAGMADRWGGEDAMMHDLMRTGRPGSPPHPAGTYSIGVPGRGKPVIAQIVKSSIHPSMKITE